jgi:glycosyltransferase involved in cell wall biosynthesis
MTEIPITILMPVYNVERYVPGAVESMLRQTWQDFELLIVNDGSTDGTRAMLSQFHDPRIRMIDQPHGGLASALRAGIDQARGRYVARMDADDEALPHRLAVQKACLDRSPQVVLVHSLAQPIDVAGRPVPRVLGEPRPSLMTKWLLLWRNPILHPTVMLRRSTLRDHGLNYQLELFRADEFDLWNRLAPHGDFEAIPEVLHRYRLHPESMTRRNPVDLHLAAFTRVIRENFERLGMPLGPAAEELAIISGGTAIDPITYRYPHLEGSLHGLMEALSQRFCAAFGVVADELAAVQAEQLLRWARYMLGTSRGYAAELLRRGVRRHRAAVRTPFFWAVATSLAVPAPLRRFARRRSGRPPMSARAG